MMIGIIFLIAIVYILLILSLIFGFWIETTLKNKHLEAKTNFSVIIPFRDETLRLPMLLASIKELQYPSANVSFWFVDDASEDDSCQIIETFCKENSSVNIKILENKRVSNSPKKDAILTAITQIKSDWIVTTDADCILPTHWLQLYNQEIILKQHKMIAAPVTYKEDASFFNYFQLLDFLSLQGTTIGSFGLQLPFMCNGANLAYQKSAFLEVQGFTGNDTIASGDDVFLLEKFVQKWPKKVCYLKSKKALVTTFSVATFRDLVSQRVRWASKSANYNLPTGKLIGISVILMNLACCMFPFLLLFTTISWQLMLLLFYLKIIVDGILLFQTIQFTEQKFRFLYFILSAILYPFFTIFILFQSLFKNYTWKNRKFKM
ncbi:Undecaprenyl-phosphate 4-deoxy-4-formamido-L-arabinose transferase [Kordia antarctica]|uniref:Undecaprenyl-phosphate 4-deoxy-4-formamido-L-arabinose transferase n=1 Tax=Kordia antarctica TaxID=1218801 RepID=A0A7L4ZNS1_9FLAO|nr:glycosyltransferase [Kordia antarctica]QHI38265.1 Undecaprenyl-phosphate 4-deoxy-4-formamido-L-arabinose transferase [Kordia antarctica]